jgi:hypothetical protein
MRLNETLITSAQTLINITFGNHSLNHNTSACKNLFGFITDIIYKNNNNQ